MNDLCEPVIMELAEFADDGTLYGCSNLRTLPERSFRRLDDTGDASFADPWPEPQRQAALARMHRTPCLRHCTHPSALYQEMIESLRAPDRPHTQFV